MHFNRRGAALLWALVIIATFTAILAAMLPTVMSANDVDQVDASADMLREVARAVRKFDSTVTRSAGNYFLPNRLNQLTNVVTNGGQAGCSFAGTNDQYNNTSVTNWNANGPYGPFYMTTVGLMTPIGRLNDTPSQTYLTVGTTRTAITDPYYIQMQNVDIKLARLLDALVDGTPNAAADTVFYTAVAADSTTTVSWRVYLLNNAC